MTCDLGSVDVFLQLRMRNGRQRPEDQGRSLQAVEGLLIHVVTREPEQSECPPLIGSLLSIHPEIN